VTPEAIVLEPPQRIRQGLLKRCHSYSLQKTSGSPGSPEVKVNKYSESDGHSLGEPSLDILERNDGMFSDNVSIYRKKHELDEKNLSFTRSISNGYPYYQS